MEYTVLDGARFGSPIGKIVCVGRNYVEHIKELGNEVPAAPVLFMKPSSSVINDGGRVEIPVFSNDCHHEVELAILIGKGGKSIQESQVIEHIAGYGIAIDLTLRDVQAEQKKKGLPWEIAKGFDTACPLSGFVSPRTVTDYQNLNIGLKVNGEVRQSGNTSMMIYSIPALVSYISGIFRLDEGDVILTGTPAGVGRIKSGDLLEAEIEQVGLLHVSVA